MANVVYAPEAENDISHIVDVIARDNPNAARNWLTKLRGTCDTLSTQPNIGEMRADLGVRGCRSFSFGNYVLFFRAVENGIEVARVIHGSRDLRNM